MESRKKRIEKKFRSPCPVACALDVFGDRWTLVVVRDLVMGKSRYGEFLASPEGIPTNILADRLKQLEEFGIIRKEPYQERPLRHRYILTEKGGELAPVLRAMADWAERHVKSACDLPEAQIGAANG